MAQKGYGNDGFGSILAPFWPILDPVFGSFSGPFRVPFLAQIGARLGAIFGALLGGPSGPAFERKHKETKVFGGLGVSVLAPFGVNF